MRKLAALACGGGAEAGLLGTTESRSGPPIEISAVLSGSVVPSVSRVLQSVIGNETDGFGPVHRHLFAIETLDDKYSPVGRRAASDAVVADAQVVGVIGTSCSPAAM